MNMTHFKLFSIIMLSSLLTLDAFAASNIDTTEKYAWSENSGWMNFNDINGGIMVYDDHLEGYAWAENIGWIRLGGDNGGGTPYYANTSRRNYGVNHDGDGNLSGYAWSENAGWINFNPNHSQVTMNTRTGVFDGYAWSENVGWIHFQNASPAYNVSRANFQNASQANNQNKFGDSNPDVVQFSMSRFTSNEDTGEAFVNVTCDGRCDGVSVNVVATDGSAISPDDYTQCGKTVTFTPERLTKRVRCTLVDDVDNESNEFFHVSLGNVINADLGEPSVAKVIIRDDDDNSTGNFNISTSANNQLMVIPEPANGFVFSHWEGWCADYSAATNGRVTVPSNKNIASCTPIFVLDE
ncbi:MAG: hypothetical protein DRQ49_17955 [Gammaproteobacteria bacterium]|nr:MAG: hypothetical protein DRQ49_17955 [Gammaproteobacteria bacterium]RKZ37719.1 MAG: hypothetical protein DRQ41_12935 [Gammaproteobacteria bacterium]RKZ72931.1 MAG: hypothetical protein DRQ57_16020 [Gammaproteobacteria bacterium]